MVYEIFTFFGGAVDRIDGGQRRFLNFWMFWSYQSRVRNATKTTLDFIPKKPEHEERSACANS